MNVTNQIFKSDILSRKYLFFSVLFVLLVKVILALLIIMQHKLHHGGEFIGLAYIQNDYGYFFKPVDNYFDFGQYTYNGEDPFAGRMPGYWFPYMILRFFFERYVALNLIIIFQIFMSSFAAVLLARLAFKISKVKLSYFICLLIFSTSAFLLPFDYQTVSESLSVSTFIFSLYFIYNYHEKSNYILRLLLAGFFCAWMIFLRPFTGLSLVFFCVYIFFQKQKNFNISLKSTVLFLVAFFIMEFGWCIRNYNTFDKFIPLETKSHISYGKIYSESWIGIRTLVTAWGGDAAYFEPNSMSQWFRMKEDLRSLDEVIPEQVFQNVTTYSKDDINDLRNSYLKFKSSEEYTVGCKLDIDITEKSTKYLADYKQNNLFEYYYNRLKGFNRLIISSGSSYLALPPIEKMSIFQKIIKLFSAGMYYVVLLFGSLHIITLILKRNFFALINFGLLFSTCCVIVFYSSIQESRYFLIPFTILMLYASISFSHIQTVFKKLKLHIFSS